MIKESSYTKAETYMILCMTRGQECTPQKCKQCGWLKDEVRQKLIEHGDEPQWTEEV